MQIDMQMAAKNFQNLSQQEQEILREAADSPLLGILSKVFGQEFVESINSFSLRKPQRKMDAEMRQQAARMLMR